MRDQVGALLRRSLQFVFRILRILVKFETTHTEALETRNHLVPQPRSVLHHEGRRTSAYPRPWHPQLRRFCRRSRFTEVYRTAYPEPGASVNISIAAYKGCFAYSFSLGSNQYFDEASSL
jgi:hypothetical protein